MLFSHSPLARINTTLSRLCLTGLMVAAGASAIAQTTPNAVMDTHNQAATSGEKTKANQSMARKMGHHDPAEMQARSNKHMRELKTKLMITPAQEGAWTSFTAAMQPPAPMAQRMSHEQRKAQHAEMDKLALPERIDKTRAMRTEHMNELGASMDKRDQAVKTLYATLSPEQQKVMDAEHRKMSRHGHHDMPTNMKRDMTKGINKG